MNWYDSETIKNDDLTTKSEIIAYLRISLATLDRLIKRHAFPFIKFEKKVFFRRSEIDAYLESKTARKR
ncbi:MAG: helix-turn-helix domain-containing protein [Candidatus Aminicenantes bacterium]|nr:helix-turn-helix domain-containing protein [Candidatus Aminicenantes bacterium]